MITRDEMDKIMKANNLKLIEGKKLTQIAVLKPEDFVKNKMLSDKLLDLNMEKYKAERLVTALGKEIFYLGTEYWAGVIKAYGLPYGLEYHVDLQGTVYLVE